MNRIAIIGLLPLFILSCNNSKNEMKDERNTSKDSLKVDTVDFPTKVEVPKIDTLAHIESENNASVIASADDVTRAYVDLNTSDSILSLHANMRLDHRIFGYEKPDTNSQRLLLLSIFTNDVKNNPFKLPLGAYYETSGLDEKGLKLKYNNINGDFIEATFIGVAKIRGTTLYFEKKWIEIIPKHN